MTTNNHPITPPPELVKQWATEGFHQDYCSPFEHAIAQAAQWSADQELEACCEWLDSQHHSTTWSSRIRAARRPKPPSLKEQALEALTKIEDNKATYLDSSVIRRALEQLDD